MRRKMIEEDRVECVIGLGPNLFYNSPMEACLLITNTNKPEERRGKILIINAVKEVRQDKNIGFLEEHHIQKIYEAYHSFEDQENFARVVTIEDILNNSSSLNIALYLSNVDSSGETVTLDEVVQSWSDSSETLKSSMEELFTTLS